MSWYLTNYDPFTKWSNNQLDYLDSSDQIYILGSSQVASLNLEHIENYLNENKSNYVIYNLAQGADFPSSRLGDIDKIILLEPKIVVYGLGLRDFETKQNTNFSPLGTTQIITDNIFPTINFFNKNIELIFEENEFINKIFKSPKVITLRLFNYIIKNDFGYNYPDIKLHIPLIQSGITPIISNSDIKEKSEKESLTFRGISEIQNNPEFVAFKKILQKLEKSEIKIIVYTVPHNQAYLDIISKNDMKLFTNSIEDITMNYNIPLYYLHDNYTNLEIWGDLYHVAYNNNTIIYSNDIAEIIKKEINP
jgi:hypothetical protein